MVKTGPILGGGKFQYEPVPEWGRLPEGWSFVEVAAVAADSAGLVYVFNRGEHPMIVLDREGQFQRSWGEGAFNRAHGMWMGPDDMLYLTDDLDHTVRKFTTDGELVLTLGRSGSPSDTGVEDFDYRSIKQAAGPFHYPTNLALATDGSMYVTDGYGNARVHKFSSDGNLLFSWGEPGDGPGQFHLPHGIALDGDGRVFVADRENSRVQIFWPEGTFIDQWTDIVRPCQVFIDGANNVFVAEVGAKVGLFPWMKPDPTRESRISVYDSDGNLQTSWGGGDDPYSFADVYAPHDIWVDGQGDVYVGEVVVSAGGKPEYPSLKKFRRVNK